MKTQENDDQFYKFFSILAPSAYSSVTFLRIFMEYRVYMFEKIHNRTNILGISYIFMRKII